MTEQRNQFKGDDVTASDSQSAIDSASEMPSVSNNAAIENQTMLNIASNRTRLGFLSLPAEIRQMIYGELFHRPRVLPFNRFSVIPIPALMKTCKLINQEAFEVLWGENRYHWISPPPNLEPSLFQRIVDTMQRLEICVLLSKPSAKFIEMIHAFRKPARIRSILKITFVMVRDYPDGETASLRWFMKGLGRFANFKIIEIDFVHRSNPVHISNLPSQLIAEVLQPRLGSAKPRADGLALHFHPQDDLNAHPPQEIIDGMELWDGIRLDWN